MPNIFSNCWKSPKTYINSVSHSVMSDSLWPQGLQLASLLCLWNSPGKKTGIGQPFPSPCSFQLRDQTQVSHTAVRLFTLWVTRKALENLQRISQNIYQKKTSLYKFTCAVQAHVVQGSIVNASKVKLNVITICIKCMIMGWILKIKYSQICSNALIELHPM